MKVEPREPLFVNTFDLAESVAESDKTLLRHLQAGRTVLNAPRPIGGPAVHAWVGWDSDSRCGRFYAAYEPGEAPNWGEWNRMDADEIQGITNEEILPKLALKLAEDGYALAEIVESYERRHVARSHFGYRDVATSDEVAQRGEVMRQLCADQGEWPWHVEKVAEGVR